MKRRLTPKQSRALALLLLLAVVSAVVAAMALPTWLLHKRYDSYLDDSSDRLRRYQRVAALRPAIAEEIKAVEMRAGRQYYLKGVSATSSAAELQGLVTGIIETHNGKIVSSQVIPAKEDGKKTGPAKASISVQMNASMVPLLVILYTLETGQPYLFVDQLTVRTGLGRAYKPVGGVEPEFVVQFTVSGFALAGGGKP